MPTINHALFKRLQDKTGLSKGGLYRRISNKASQSMLPRDLAAIALAADLGINIARFATEHQLSQIRQAGGPMAPKPAPADGSAPGRTRGIRKVKRGGTRRPEKRRATTVFVVHGRNDGLRTAMFRFLRSIGLHPLEWGHAIRLTRKASPYVSQILDAAFAQAVGVVVLLSPDDQARLKREFLKTRDPQYERRLSGQARPNVLFEAGMAFGRHPDSTVLVQVGDIRPFSDIAGHHVVRLSNSTESRQELVAKLQNAGCNVDTSGTDWHTEGDFSST